MKRAKIILAFNGTGKTYCCDKFEYTNIRLLDLDRKIYHHHSGLPWEEIPVKVIDFVSKELYEYDIIFVPLRKEICDTLWKLGFEFTVVYPDVSLKEEYLERYKKRESSQSFIDLLDKNWDMWITEIESMTGRYNLIKLQRGETLMNLIRKSNELQSKN